MLLPACPLATGCPRNAARWCNLLVKPSKPVAISCGSEGRKLLMHCAFNAHHSLWKPYGWWVAPEGSRVFWTLALGRRLWHFAWPHRRQLFLGFLAQKQHLTHAYQWDPPAHLRLSKWQHALIHRTGLATHQLLSRLKVFYFWSFGLQLGLWY